MPSPEEALDVLMDQAAFSQWLTEQGISYAEGRKRLTELADEALADEAPAESRMLQRARAAHAERRVGDGARDDVEQLCDFVENAGRLPSRLLDVFHNCIVAGMTHRECAERLAIAPETVRSHLRRLRQLMRRRPPALRNPE